MITWFMISPESLVVQAYAFDPLDEMQAAYALIWERNLASQGYFFPHF